MLTAVSTWLIVFGIPLAAYGVSKFFNVQEIFYSYIALGTLFMTIPLIMSIFRGKLGGWTPKIVSWGRIVTGACIPAGVFVLLTGYFIIPISMSSSTRLDFISHLNHPWMIGFEIFIFLCLVTLMLVLWLWDQSVWIAHKTYQDKEGNIIYLGQELRYRIFHRNRTIVALPCGFTIWKKFSETAMEKGYYRNHYVAKAYAKVGFKEAQARSISRIDILSFEKEVREWGKQALSTSLPQRTFNQMCTASEEPLATIDIQGIPIRLYLSYVSPSWMAGDYHRDVGL